MRNKSLQPDALTEAAVEHHERRGKRFRMSFSTEYITLHLGRGSVINHNQ